MTAATMLADTRVRVLYDYSYVSVEGLHVAVIEGEELRLVDDAPGAEWWRVRRGDSEFYVPANYVQRLSCSRPPVARSCSAREERSVAVARMTSVVAAVAATPAEALLDKSPTSPGAAPAVSPLSLPAPRAPVTASSTASTATSLSPLVERKEEAIYENLAVIQALIHGGRQQNNDSCGSAGAGTDLSQWELHTDEESGRVYYYNAETNETSWEPPPLSPGDGDSAVASSSQSLPDLTQLPSPPLPAAVAQKDKPGRAPPAARRDAGPDRGAPQLPAHKYSKNWSASHDENGTIILIYIPTGERWYQATDDQGRVYYYKENSQESVWELPEAVSASQGSPWAVWDSGASVDVEDVAARALDVVATDLTTAVDDGASVVSRAAALTATNGARAAAPAAASATGAAATAAELPGVAVVDSDDSEDDAASSVLRYQPLASDGDSDTEPTTAVDGRADAQQESQRHNVLVPQTYGVDLDEKRGLLNRCKIMEAGKKIKKVWHESYVVTSGMKLIFYKDEKAAISTIAAPHGKPEAIISLERAAIQWSSQKTTKRNVLEVACRGSLFLLQHDDVGIMQQWFVVLSVKATPRPASSSMPATKTLDVPPADVQNAGSEASSREKVKGLKKLRASVTKNRKSSIELTSVRDRLKNLITKRPAIESLQQKGIIKESVFNARLDHLCLRESTTVPRFVEQCILAIEIKGLDFDGIYRISGNLAQIQSLRFYVNQQENWDLLGYDLHVLTGALKLFFRELPEPLIPFDAYLPLINLVCEKSSVSQRDSAVKSLLSAMPLPNRDTLRCLFDHLIRVLQNSKKNRMQIHSLAIIFGPTLMWPAVQTSAVATRLTYQNKVVEYLLENWSKGFV